MLSKTIFSNLISLWIKLLSCKYLIDNNICLKYYLLTRSGNPVFLLSLDFKILLNNSPFMQYSSAKYKQLLLIISVTPLLDTFNSPFFEQLNKVTIFGWVNICNINSFS